MRSEPESVTAEAPAAPKREFGYIAFRACGCWFAVCVDDPRFALDISKMARDAVKIGGRMHRDGNGQIRDLLQGPNKCESCAKPTKKSAQARLF